MGWTIEGVIVPETLSRPTRPMAARVWIFLPSDLMARLVLLQGSDPTMVPGGCSILVIPSMSGASGGPSLSGRSWPLRQTRLVVMTWLVVVAKFVVSVGMAELATSIRFVEISVVTRTRASRSSDRGS
uniref:Uncharacterized protein n=1 Tax=Cannabis sativa TaxID=3483 RepID=A0A803PSM0_CANSA